MPSLGTKPEDDDFVLEAHIVGDKRKKMGRRLGIFGMAILLLFFAISAYIQSAQNGRLLRRAAEDRSSLVQSVTSLSSTVDTQTRLIKRLQNAIREQNELLEEAGIPTVRIPMWYELEQNPQRPNEEFRPAPSQNQAEGPGKNSNNEPEPSPKKPDPPKEEPTPDQLPGGDVRKRVCELTGICP